MGQISLTYLPCCLLPYTFETGFTCFCLWRKTRNILSVCAEWYFKYTHILESLKSTQRHMVKPAAYRGTMFVERSLVMFWPSVFEILWEHSSCISAEAWVHLAKVKMDVPEGLTIFPCFLVNLFCFLIASVQMFIFPILPHSSSLPHCLLFPYLHSPSPLLT